MSKISDEIKTDHRELRGWYDKIVNPANEDEQVRAQNQFAWELARHSVGEELVVYPAMEQHVSGGKELADRDRQEHQVVCLTPGNRKGQTYNADGKQVKEVLKQFQNMSPSDANYMPTIKNLMENLSKHMKEEEIEDLVKLDKALSQDQKESLGKSFDRTKAFVPSRAHPSAPSKPPFETAVSLLTAPIDHVADLFRRFPDTVSPNPSAK